MHLASTQDIATWHLFIENVDGCWVWTERSGCEAYSITDLPGLKFENGYSPLAFSHLQSINFTPTTTSTNYFVADDSTCSGCRRLKLSTIHPGPTFLGPDPTRRNVDADPNRECRQKVGCLWYENDNIFGQGVNLICVRIKDEAKITILKQRLTKSFTVNR